MSASSPFAGVATTGAGRFQTRFGRFDGLLAFGDFDGEWLLLLLLLAAAAASPFCWRWLLLLAIQSLLAHGGSQLTSFDFVFQ